MSVLEFDFDSGVAGVFWLDVTFDSLYFLKCEGGFATTAVLILKTITISDLRDPC